MPADQRIDRHDRLGRGKKSPVRWICRREMGASGSECRPDHYRHHRPATQGRCHRGDRRREVCVLVSNLNPFPARIIVVHEDLCRMDLAQLDNVDNCRRSPTWA